MGDETDGKTSVMRCNERKPRIENARVYINTLAAEILSRQVPCEMVNIGARRSAMPHNKTHQNIPVSI
jgi:hypothetical protein